MSFIVTDTYHSLVKRELFPTKSHFYQSKTGVRKNNSSKQTTASKRVNLSSKEPTKIGKSPKKQSNTQKNVLKISTVESGEK